VKWSSANLLTHVNAGAKAGFVVEGVVDSSVEAGHGGLIRSLEERAEGARFEAAVVVGGR